MAFFLIGRGPDDDLQVLSDKFFESRQDAMAELSNITTDPSFDRWDSEVFVMDLSNGAPVLLVRPKTSDSPARAYVAPSHAAAEDISDTGSEEPEDTELEEGPAEAELEEAPEPSLPVEPSATETPEPPSEAEEPEELRDALRRTAESMTSEGLVPPESAGFEEAEAPSEPEQATEPQAEITAEAGPEPVVAEAPEQSTAPWPWDAEAGPAEETAPPPSPEIATLYEELEKPEEPPQTPEEAPVPAEEAGADSAKSDTDFILDLDAVQPISLEESQEPQPSEESSSEAPAEPPAEERVESVPQQGEYSSPLTEYTCEDCVYVETCPNAGQRAPKDCGSFQWK